MYIHSRMIRPAVLSHWLRGEKKRHDCSHVATCNLVILVTKQQTIGTHTFQWQSCRFTIYSFRDFWTLYTWIDHPTHAVLVRLSERISVNFMEAKEKVNTDLRILQIWQALRKFFSELAVKRVSNGTAWHSPTAIKQLHGATCQMSASLQGKWLGPHREWQPWRPWAWDLGHLQSPLVCW